MTREEILTRLESTATPKRFIHSLNVANTAVKLAQRYNEDVKKADIAGLLHDCARDMKSVDIFKLCDRFAIKVDNIMLAQPKLLHGPIGAKIAATEYGIADEAVLSAIWCHTTGRENMSVLDKIVYIADYTEPDRNFPGIAEIRETAFNNIDQAIILSLNKTIIYVISKGLLIHPESVNARNFLIARRKM